MAPWDGFFYFVISVLTEINVKIYQHHPDCKGWTLRQRKSILTSQSVLWGARVETLEGFIAFLFWTSSRYAFWLAPPAALLAALLMLRKRRACPQWLALSGAAMAVIGELYRLFMRQGVVWAATSDFQIKIERPGLFSAVAFYSFLDLGFFLFAVGTAWVALRREPVVRPSLQNRIDQMANHD